MIQYHEKKVSAGVASLIHAENFLQDLPALDFVAIRDRFERLHALNTHIVRHNMHVSLNFAPEDQPSKDELIQISREYMQLIGFGEQPYVVVEHLDAGHPHVHILSSNIRSDGSPIHLHMIGRDKSLPASQLIDLKYQLNAITKLKRNTDTSPSRQSLKYGSYETSRLIADVVDFVIRTYNFSDLFEFNAVLKVYNVRADSGKPGGNLHRLGGMVYQMLDDDGKAIGGRLKASDIPSRPVLKTLEEKFARNALKRMSYTGNVISRIDWVLHQHPADWTQLTALLHKEQIRVLPLVNKEGYFYDLIFIDQKKKLAISTHNLWKGHAPIDILQQAGLDKLIPAELFLPSEHRIPDPAQVSRDIVRGQELLKRSEAGALAIRNTKKQRRSI